MLLDQLRFKASLPVSRDSDLNLALRSLELFAARPIAGVGRLLGASSMFGVAQMRVQLRL